VKPNPKHSAVGRPRKYGEKQKGKPKSSLLFCPNQLQTFSLR